MYNYLSNIAVLFSSYFFGLRFVLMVNSGMTLYKEQCKNNLYTFLLTGSLYLLGIWKTLFYSCMYFSFRIINDYDKIVPLYNKIRNDLTEFMTFYENEKKNNPDKVIREIELFNKVVLFYNMMRTYVSDKITNIINNKYITFILKYVMHINYEYYIELINNKINIIVQLLNKCIKSNEKLNNFKEMLISYFEKIKEQHNKYSAELETATTTTTMEQIPMMNMNMNSLSNPFNIDNLNNASNMNDMMNTLFKEMNISEDELKGLTNNQQIPSQAPSIDDLNKLMLSLNELQKISTEMKSFNPNNLQNMTKAQRKALKKIKKNQ